MDMASALPMISTGLGSSLERLGAALNNGLEIARFGGLTEPEASPYEVVVHEHTYMLRRYFPDTPVDGPPIMLVPPLMMTAEVWDVSRETSAVRMLAAAGIDPWVVDFGDPEREKGGLARTLADHVLAVSASIGHVHEHTGRNVHAGGYCQGGMFCYQAAAYRNSDGVGSIIAFGSPVDVRRALPPAVPDELWVLLRAGLDDVTPIISKLSLPGWMTKIGFRLLDPVKDLRQRIDFLRRLYDREWLMHTEAQRRFLAGAGFIAYPGPALRDLVDQIVVHNRLMLGGMVIGDHTISLADIKCPILAIVGEIDDIARPAAVRGIVHAAPNAEVYEMTMRSGHFGLVVGSKSKQITWPTVAGWIRWCEGMGERPETVRSMDGEGPPEAPEAAAGGDLREGAMLAMGLLSDALGIASRTLVDRGMSLLRLAGTVGSQLGRLTRLGGIQADTPISPALVLAEQASDSPEATIFLFAGRAFSYAEVDRRVDAVARGLISVGIRQGDRVGLLMSTRPSTLAMTTALSRIGAVAVMLRPGTDLAREIETGEAEFIVADPEHAALAIEVSSLPVFVLGGAGQPRSLPEGAADLESIDPEAVELPAWYEPNSGRADDTCLVLFSGEGEDLRPLTISNRRWALSAFGAASAGALTANDTVYCCTPLHHPTGILVCVGGALVGGARLAVATRFDAGIFWDEVRRYGASVVFYAGTMLTDVAFAPPRPGERDHPVRLFAGSGMPRGAWKRLTERYGATIVEFYASTQDNAVLANLSGKKIGSVGRPLPGSAEVALVGFDAERRRIVRNKDGFAVRCTPGEAGLLLVRVEHPRAALGLRLLRGVFAKGDAWIGRGALFRCDAEGDYWLVGRVADLIDTPAGTIFSAPIEDALSAVRGVELVVAYGVTLPGGRRHVPVAAVRVPAGVDVDPADIRHAVSKLDVEQRPVAIRVVNRVPLTAGYRPQKAALRAQGVDPSQVEGIVLAPVGKTEDWGALDADGFARLCRATRRAEKAPPGAKAASEEQR